MSRRLWLPGTRTTVRPGPSGGIPNGSLSPCTTSVGDLNRVQLGQPALGGIVALAGWVQREGEAQDGDCADIREGAARDPRAGRAPAGDDRKPAQRVRAQLLENRRPGRIELVRGRRATTARDPVRLLDERNGVPRGVRSLSGRNEVRRVHTAAGAVPEHEPSHRPVDGAEESSCETVGRVELEDPAA